MVFENYCIRDFMDAWFSENYTVLSKEDFDICYTEYIDATGLYLSETFEKVVYINSTLNRINTVKIEIELQRRFINEYGIPYLRHFDFLTEEFGYILSWNKDYEDFENQLYMIESSEKVYISEYEASCKELEEIKSKESDKELTNKQRRSNFIRMLNTLGKTGYKIDNWKTTVEELALMIKQQMEEVSNV